jgi:hypothetical protein
MFRHAAIASVLLFVGLASPALAAPVFSFDTEAVLVEGLSPDASVAFYALTREWTGASTRVTELAEVLTDDDGDGVVRYDLERPLPKVSVWLAVDLSTGELAVAGPEGFTPRELSFPPGAIRHGPTRRLDRLELTGRSQHLVLVRSGSDPDDSTVGAWLLRLGDGGDQDDDETPGRMGFLLSRMTPLGASPAPPEELVDGDVLAVLDPETLDFTVVTLTTGRGL